MHRATGRPDEALTKLLDERDHVNIQLSLLRDRAGSNGFEVLALRAKYRELESQIEARRRPI